MSAEVNGKTQLRPMLPADVPVLAAIFQAAVEELTEDDYSEEQREIWAATADDEAAFGARLSSMLTIVATIGGAPIGFASLEGRETFDMLYVYPPVTRQGVATLLSDAIERLAAGRGATKLTVDASDTARAFFEGRGYAAQRRQTVMRSNCWFGNTRMEKVLGS